MSTVASPSEPGTGFDPAQALAGILAPIGMTLRDTGGLVEIVGDDPVMASRHRLGAAAAIAMMSSAVAASIMRRERTGRAQDLRIELERAISGINPHLSGLPTLNGHPIPHDRSAPNPIRVEPYRTSDGRWVCVTGAYRHMLYGWLELLGTPPNRIAVEKAISNWRSDDLEAAARTRGLAFAVCRTPEEWAENEQGRLQTAVPVVEVRRIGDGPPKPFAAADRPLAGVRVLCNTHAISGPVVGRTMAEHGAEVLHISAVDQVEHDVVYCDANVGLRSAYVDLRDTEGNRLGQALAARADVVVENFTGGALARLGFSPEELAARCPGTVTVTVRCYGFDGPWGDWGGHDHQGTAASGLMAREGSPEFPILPPTSMLNDYLTGYLGATGAVAALVRRAKEGGSYHVVVSLVRTAMWVDSLGLVENDPKSSYPRPLTIEGQTPLGVLCRLAPAVTMSATPPRWEEPMLVPRGFDPPQWQRE